MRAALLSLLRVTVAVAVLALAGAALVTQPVLGSIAAPRERAVPATLLTHVTQLTTAFLRNPHYHTRNDTAATLDYQRMARVVDGVFSAITHPSHLKEAI
ncbi:MAG TPA: hypothetical protein VF266_17410 [Thermoanaerobaculia bacterium]